MSAMTVPSTQRINWVEFVCLSVAPNRNKTATQRRAPRAPQEWQLTASTLLTLGACPNSRCSILSESDSTLGDEQVFSPLEYRSDAAFAAECAGLRAERPCLAVYR